MPDCRISSGPVDVIASGTVIAFKGHPIEIAFRPLYVPLDLTPSVPPTPAAELLPFPSRVAAGFKFVFKFQDDLPTNPPMTPTLDAKVIGTFTIEVTLKNFVSPLGSGSIDPIHVAAAFNRKIFLSYRVQVLQGGDKSFTYTFYQNRTAEQPVVSPAKPPAGAKPDA
jgi:hypothetical protein